MKLMDLLKLEPARVGSVAAAVYAAGVMLYRAFVDHSGPVDTDVLVAAAAALWGLYTYRKVTPVARPRDDKGRALRPSQQ